MNLMQEHLCILILKLFSFSKDGSVGLKVCWSFQGQGRNISTIIGWISLKVCTEINGSEKINPTVTLVTPLSFSDTVRLPFMMLS